MSHVGKEGVVKVGANTVAEVTGWQITVTAELVEDSELSDEWDTFKSGTDVTKNWSASVDAHWDETDTNGQMAMVLGASITLNLYPEGAGSGAAYYTGTAIIESIQRQATRKGMVSATYQCKGSGALSQTTVGG